MKPMPKLSRSQSNIVDSLFDDIRRQASAGQTDNRYKILDHERMRKIPIRWQAKVYDYCDEMTTYALVRKIKELGLT